jgi:beta-glucanase (GH16 family)
MKKVVLDLDFTKMTSLPRDLFTVAVGDKWANKELQHYVDDAEHLYFEDGMHLKATYKDGVYESVRMHTRGKFSFQYGRIDFVAKVPKGKGTWPALWMMSEDGRYGHWPRSGEIDILEHVGRDLDKVIMCLHTEAYNHRKGSEYYYDTVIPGLSDGFHTYSLDWKEDSITYYVDGKKYAHYDKGEDGKVTTHEGWPFDHPFYVIMNLAIGGMLGGEVDETCFPQEFVIQSMKVTKTEN